mmetsp:Transcript_1712/g.1816  ORF Transcript_1712/g.1816 Transcript_1712/m.1816 type:complete len:106 (-) Transcript_1712:229-546(-)
MNVKQLSRFTALSRSSVINAAPIFFKSSSTAGFDKKERADEKRFFNKKEAAALKSLLKKMEDEGQTPAEILKKERDQLVTILGKHGVRFSEDLYDDLILWKSGDL